MREFFGNRKVLIIGNGISGQGAGEALAKLGAQVTVADEAANARIISRKFVSEFNLIITSPSVAPTHKIYKLAKSLKLEIYGEAELGARLFSGTLIGITGTNGKTTTVSLLGEILKRAGKNAAVCGNIGVSFAHTAVFTKPDIAVCELSSFQLEDSITLKPHIAIITNISPDHLDRHGSFNAYAAAKCAIAKNQTKAEYLIVSQDDIPLYCFKNFRPDSRVLYTSRTGKVHGAYVTDGTVYYDNQPIIAVNQIRLIGGHNLSNCLFAVCAAKLLEVENSVIAEVLREFEGEKHRVQLIAHQNGKNFYNDSKGTNIAASLAAAKAMQGTCALILGGKEKGCSFDELFANLPDNVVYIAAIGEAADTILRSAAATGYTKKHTVEKKDTLQDAVSACAQTPAQNVLLSPACASFDMFKDYAARGNAFAEAVANLG